MSNIVYVGTYFDTLGRKMPNDKKIGITTDDVSSRQRALSRTKSPIGFVMLRAWKIGGDARDIERALHSVFKDQQITGEWFKDVDETVIDGVKSVMDLLSRFGATVEEMDLDTQEVVDDEESATNSASAKLVRKTSDKSFRKHFPEKFIGESLKYGRGQQTGNPMSVVIDILGADEYRSNHLQEVFQTISEARLATNIYLTDAFGCGNMNSVNRSHWDQMTCVRTGKTVDQMCEEFSRNEGEVK